jgi:hypothetical protein
MKYKLESSKRNNMKTNGDGVMPTDPFILNLDTKLILVVSITLRPNYPKGNGCRYRSVES